MPQTKEKFIIIDGNALLHRAFHALPPMTTKNGLLVNAAYGFTSILLKIIRELKPDYLCAAFDRKGKSLRTEEFAEYKAQRKKQPDELYRQIPLIEKVLKAFRVPVIDSKKEGYEADDVIGTVVARLKEKDNLQTIIVTGDLDALQLVDKQTEVFTLKKGFGDTITYDRQAVKDRYGLNPGQLTSFKALRGDPSDNIPGVKGIGEKTASLLIQEFGSLDKLYQNLDSDKIKDKVRNLLKEHKQEAFLSKKLVTIQTDLPTNFKLQDTKVEGIDEEAVIKIFTELEFKSLMSKIPSELGGKKEAGQGRMEFLNLPDKADSKLKYHLIEGEDKFRDFLEKLTEQKEFALDTETTSLDVWQARLLGLSVAWKKDEAYYIAKPTEKWLKALKPILEDEGVKKIGHHLKYDYEMLMQSNIRLKGIGFDTLLAAYLLSAGDRNLKLDDLVFAELGHRMKPIEDLIGPKGKNQITMDQVPVEQVSWYACEDADFTLKLAKKLQPQIDQIEDRGLLAKLEQPLIPVLADMEQAGIKLDKKFLKNLDQKFSRKIKAIEEKIYNLAGVQFNIASPIQLKKILFETLKIDSKGLKKTKTGLSTAAFELEKLKGRHEIIPLISEFREYSKLKNTYTATLEDQADANGRIHTSFNQTVTATGRLSSSDPNLQNIPIRTDIGKEIRKAFIAEKGYRLVSADYSQIELRIIASLSGDEKMIEAFKKKEDIHARTAAEINKIDIKEVTRQERRAAKEINFGVIYGLGSVGLAQRTGLSREEAKDFIERYFNLYPKVKKWLDETKQLASDKGFVETLLGRRRYLPDIHSGVQMIRAGAERMAVNAPIQGTAADLLKMAMIKIHQQLPEVSPKSRMLLTVHDELVFEVPDAEIDKVTEFIKDIMENVYTLKVPIKVEAGSGKNWGDCK